MAPTEYKFVADGGERKRKAPYSACDYCKRRKKRCQHVIDDPAPLDTQQYEKHKNESSLPPSEASHSMSAARSRSSRFIGELNPAVALKGEDEEVYPRRQDRHNVGTWIEDDKQDAGVSEDDQEESVDIETIQLSSPNIGQDRTLPNQGDQAALLQIFHNRIQPLLPVLEGSDDIPPMLMQAICLVTSKDARAKPHLQLGGQLLSVSEFARRLLIDADTRLKMVRPHTVDRIHLIQTHLLLSLHCEGPNGAEGSSLHLCQAIFHAHSIGLHLVQTGSDVRSKTTARPHVPHAKHAHSPKHRYRLFWCLWSMDRLNAAINGRPRLIINDDVGLDFKESLSLFTPTARLWMHISEILEQVIALYSPNATAGREESITDFPAFEELLSDDIGAIANLDQDMIASLELYYHAVGMTSCRLRLQSGRWRGSCSALRRNLCVANVCSMLDHLSIEAVTPLPIVPYTISLTLLVVYQQYRQSSRRIARAVAIDQMERCQKTLEQMGSAWWPAKNMARIGKRVLQQVFQKEKQPQARNITVIDTPAPAKKDQPLFPANSTHPMVSNLQIAADNPSQAARDHQQTLVEGTFDSDGALDGFDFDETAFADMDAVFGNLMEMNMNAFPDNMDFAFVGGMDESG